MQPTKHPCNGISDEPPPTHTPTHTSVPTLLLPYSDPCYPVQQTCSVSGCLTGSSPASGPLLGVQPLSSTRVAPSCTCRKERQCLSREKAVQTQCKGSVLAAKAVQTQCKGSALPSRPVRPALRIGAHPKGPGLTSSTGLTARCASIGRPVTHLLPHRLQKTHDSAMSPQENQESLAVQDSSWTAVRFHLFLRLKPPAGGRSAAPLAPPPRSHRARQQDGL